NPELAEALPDEIRDAFERLQEEGRLTSVCYRHNSGWHVRGRYAVRDSAARPEAGDAAADTADDAKPKKQPKGMFRLRPFVPFDLATLPPREWLYGRHYQRNTVGVTVAPGGFGKTTLCMVEAVAMATARNLLGEQPSERLRIWYHNGEDNIEELNR